MLILSVKSMSHMEIKPENRRKCRCDSSRKRAFSRLAGNKPGGRINPSPFIEVSGGRPTTWRNGDSETGRRHRPGRWIQNSQRSGRLAWSCRMGG
jgi:hypothetical protein